MKEHKCKRESKNWGRGGGAGRNMLSSACKSSYYRSDFKITMTRMLISCVKICQTDPHTSKKEKPLPANERFPSKQTPIKYGLWMKDNLHARWVWIYFIA